MLKWIDACRFVQMMKRRHGANPAYVWDVLAGEFNIIKGLGCVLSPDEADEAEQIIIDGLK